MPLGIILPVRKDDTSEIRSDIKPSRQNVTDQFQSVPIGDSCSTNVRFPASAAQTVSTLRPRGRGTPSTRHGTTPPSKIQCLVPSPARSFDPDPPTAIRPGGENGNPDTLTRNGHGVVMATHPILRTGQSLKFLWRITGNGQAQSAPLGPTGPGVRRGVAHHIGK